MSERRMSEIMSQRDRLRQGFIHPKRLCDRPGDLGDLQRVRQPRAVVVAFRGQKDLCLVFQAAK